MLTAVIFDMDGVLIDSEPFWQRAQMAVFAALGQPLSQADCESTIGVRIDQLVAHWYRQRPWHGPTPAEVVQQILDQVVALILSEGQAKAGVLETLALIEGRGLKIGLATSSPFAMVEAVLGKLGIRERFLAVHSAEVERFGKPHPDVYIHAAEKLGVLPVECLAIEDSFTGLLAAKAASMQALIVPDPALVGDPRLAIADHQLRSLTELDAAMLARWVG
ncbi:hexitol phosphatase HxpB [Aeromonas cavernicola]|uniref:2-deoxyglucose-6-phosphatase n=1 Tax=Aeromonas cavernicola TaxID=1006623 RepID=A0A2H9U2Y5_9GAMM|nr:hexitol phosphatase HxpB [Aeromonas cavernicola]PJG58383.1 2-deoxyglucose-6-phosphatase [Aeromonas cavernicola]